MHKITELNAQVKQIEESNLFNEGCSQKCNFYHSNIIKTDTCDLIEKNISLLWISKKRKPVFF